MEAFAIMLFEKLGLPMDELITADEIKEQAFDTVLVVAHFDIGLSRL